MIDEGNPVLDMMREVYKQKQKEAQMKLAPRLTSWGHVIRSEMKPFSERHPHIEKPNQTHSSEELLRRFYKLNPSAKDNGYKTQKYPWFAEQCTFHAFHFSDRFIVYVRQDKENETHSIHLNYVSAWDKRQYWIASAPMQHCPTIKYWSIKHWQQILKQLIVFKKFKVGILHLETDIPIH